MRPASQKTPMPEPPAYPGPEEFEELIKTERPKLVRIAYRILCDQHEAEDVVQATLTIVWSRANAPRQLQAYLHRAVELNALKRRMRRRRHVPLDAAPELLAATAESDERGQPLNPIELERAIMDLPLSQQVILRLRFYTGMSFRQISKNLKISQNTAASRCRYAMMRLRETFANRYEEERE